MTSTQRSIGNVPNQSELCGVIIRVKTLLIAAAIGAHQSSIAFSITETNSLTVPAE